MMQIRRILCPLDFSDASRHALDHAVVLAGWYRANITALYVRHGAVQIEPPILFAQLESPPMDSLEEAEARLHQWLQPARAVGLTCEVLAVDGNNAAGRIVETAKSIHADLLVMGTHGRGGFERLLLGSVTEKVVRSAPCPVLTVPPPAESTASLPFKRLLCGIDFSEPSVNALKVALSIAKESDATVTLAHSIEHPVENEALAMFDMDAFRDALRKDTASKLEGLLTEEDRTYCNPHIRLMEGKPFEKLLDVAADEKTDLIVLGVHGRNALNVLVFGSTTNQVIRRATCPVLTLRS